MSRNFYQILKVSRNSSQNEIKKSFHKLALQFHPDLHNDPTYPDILKEITEAYSTLIDPVKRRQYDEEIELSFPTSNYRSSNSYGPNIDPNYTISQQDIDFRNMIREASNTVFSSEEFKQADAIRKQMKMKMREADQKFERELRNKQRSETFYEKEKIRKKWNNHESKERTSYSRDEEIKKQNNHRDPRRPTINSDWSNFAHSKGRSNSSSKSRVEDEFSIFSEGFNRKESGSNIQFSKNINLDRIIKEFMEEGDISENIQNQKTKERISTRFSKLKKDK